MHEKTKAHVLVVDDSDINREIICNLLRGMGVFPVEAGNGLEACEIFAHRDIDLILMDLRMPLMDGLEATRRIRESSSSIPILAMTATEDAADKEQAIALGMNGFLSKPVAPQALQASISEWISLPSLPDAKSSISAEFSLHGNQLHGIDSRQGLANVAGNEALYANLLLRFAQKYRNSPQDFIGEHTDKETLARLAHTVKGVAANLGMKTLASHSGSIENAIRSHQEIDLLVSSYSEELKNILADIEKLRPADTPKKQGRRELPPEEVPYVLYELERLPKLMQTDWGQAQHIMEKLADLLAPTDAQEQYEAAVNAQEDFDFQAFTTAIESLATFARRCAKN